MQFVPSMPDCQAFANVIVQVVIPPDVAPTTALTDVVNGIFFPLAECTSLSVNFLVAPDEFVPTKVTGAPEPAPSSLASKTKLAVP